MDLDKSRWEQVSLDDVVINKKITVDARNSGLDKYIAGDHMATEDIHLRNFGIIGDDYLGPAFHRKFEKGDILYGSRRTYLKKVAIASFNGITSNTTFVLQEKGDRIIPGLIPFLMLSDRFTNHSVKHSKGSVNPYINYKDIGQYEFLLPPIDQQAKLAELLWAADEVVERLYCIKSKTIIVKERLRKTEFSGSNGAFVKAKDILKLTTGGTPSTTIAKYWKNGKIKWMSSGDVHRKIIYDVDGRITDDGLKNSSTKLIPVNSVVIALAGQGKTKGTVAITKVELCTNQSVAAFLPNEKIILPEFLYHFLDSKYSDFREMTGDTNSRTGLNLGILKELLIPNIGIQTQQRIVNKFNLLDRNYFNLNSQITSIKSIQKQLINQIFS